LEVGTSVDVSHYGLVFVTNNGNEQVHHEHHHQQGRNYKDEPFIGVVLRGVSLPNHEVEHHLRGSDQPLLLIHLPAGDEGVGESKQHNHQHSHKRNHSLDAGHKQLDEDPVLRESTQVLQERQETD
jgi:hypothetical protein